MRRVSWAFSLVLLAPALAPAQASDGWAAKLFKDGTSHDFGSVPYGGVLAHKFTITNIYAVPLQFVPSKPTCGCVTLAANPNLLLQPRETGTVEIFMDTRKMPTPQKTVQIAFSVQSQPGTTPEPFFSSSVLTVAASYRRDVVLNPSQVSFGVVPQGRPLVQTIDVEYAGTLNWLVTGVAKHEGPIDVQIQQKYRQPGRVGYTLSVTLKAGAPAGELKQILHLQTNDPASPLLPVLVEATVQAPLAVAPASVSLGNVKVGEVVTRRVTVRGTSKAFKILSVDGQGDGVTATVPPVAAPVQVVVIEVKPTAAGPFRKTLTFKSDLDPEASATVTVEGTAVGP
jgi:Protein of unknown function (DUF1573)